MEFLKSVLDKLKGVRQKMGNITCCKTNPQNDEEDHPPAPKKDSLLPNWMEDFLAMDFHDGVGRVIFEEREIAEVQKKSRHEPRLKQVLDEDPEIFKQGAHMTQKYYHKNLSRGAACDILNKHKKEGMWLLRDSESRKGTMSVDYYFIKVRHMQIKVATYNDEYTNSKILVVTTDLNQAFYDVHSLLEFYKLNMGPNLDTNFRCLLGQCVENAEQRDASPIRLPFTTKMHTNVVVKHGQASGSGLLAKLGSKIMRKESVKK